MWEDEAGEVHVCPAVSAWGESEQHDTYEGIWRVEQSSNKINCRKLMLGCAHGFLLIYHTIWTYLGFCFSFNCWTVYFVFIVTWQHSFLWFPLIPPLKMWGHIVLLMSVCLSLGRPNGFRLYRQNLLSQSFHISHVDWSCWGHVYSVKVTRVTFKKNTIKRNLHKLLVRTLINFVFTLSNVKVTVVTL